MNWCVRVRPHMKRTPGTNRKSGCRHSLWVICRVESRSRRSSQANLHGHHMTHSCSHARLSRSGRQALTPQCWTRGGAP
eukprot:scaffold40670_cov63-Phaeocystis_antarctica.AAC.5